jgi:WD40 repeat protein
MIDCRSGSALGHVSVPEELECMTWDPFRPEHLYCTLEDGGVVCIDVRCLGAGVSAGVTPMPQGNRAIVCAFPAHDETATAISFSAAVPGLCATSSVDATVRVWDMHSMSAEGVPTLVSYKTQNVGKLFALDFSKDEPFMMCSGGDAGIVSVWDCDEQKSIKDHFEARGTVPVQSAYAFQNSETAEATSATSASGGDDDVMEEVPQTIVATSADVGIKKKKNKKNK